jgi:hypothetical protein
MMAIPKTGDSVSTLKNVGVGRGFQTSVAGRPFNANKASYLVYLDLFVARPGMPISAGFESAVEKNASRLMPEKELDDGFAMAIDALSDASQMMADVVTSSAMALGEISATGDRIDRLNAENAETLRMLLEGV